MIVATPEVDRTRGPGSAAIGGTVNQQMNGIARGVRRRGENREDGRAIGKNHSHGSPQVRRPKSWRLQASPPSNVTKATQAAESIDAVVAIAPTIM